MSALETTRSKGSSVRAPVVTRCSPEAPARGARICWTGVAGPGLPARSRGRATRARARGADVLDRRGEPELTAQLAEQIDQRLDERAGAAAREEHAPGALEVVDQ